jgi:hypothetical protein
VHRMLSEVHMRFLVASLVFLSFHAAAQTDAQLIQSTSPQLVVFAGSDANLQALVNGLSLGQPVTLVSPSANGVLQIVTFTPPTPLGSDTARALEQARTNLISRGIPQPSAQQIAIALMGGALVTNAGPLQVPGVLTNTIPPSSAVQVRNEVGAGTGGGVFGGSAANLQALTNGLRTGTPITLSGAGANGVAQNITFTAPGGPMSPFEAQQALALANQSLALQGILSPTPEQIRTALLGGTLTASGGNLVAVQGVLQGRTRNTSDSAGPNISNTPGPNISNSPAVSGPIITSPPISTPAPITGSAPTGTPIIGSGTGGTSPIFGSGGASTSGAPASGAFRGGATGR